MTKSALLTDPRMSSWASQKLLYREALSISRKTNRWALREGAILATIMRTGLKSSQEKIPTALTWCKNRIWRLVGALFLFYSLAKSLLWERRKWLRFCELSRKKSRVILSWEITTWVIRSTQAAAATNYHSRRIQLRSTKQSQESLSSSARWTEWKRSSRCEGVRWWASKWREIGRGPGSKSRKTSRSRAFSPTWINSSCVRIARSSSKRKTLNTGGKKPWPILRCTESQISPESGKRALLKTSKAWVRKRPWAAPGESLASQALAAAKL